MSDSRFSLFFLPPLLEARSSRVAIVEPRSFRDCATSARRRCRATSRQILTGGYNCRLTVNYTTALLGQSRSYLHVDGPYQQISAIDEIKDAGLSGVALLHLRTAANITRHALPLFRERRCVADRIWRV